MEQEVMLFGTGKLSDYHETWHMPSLTPSGDYRVRHKTESDITEPKWPPPLLQQTFRVGVQTSEPIITKFGRSLEEHEAGDLGLIKVMSRNRK